MAFLRSVTRCNSIVTRKSSISSSSIGGSCSSIVNSSKFELLSNSNRSKYLEEICRELNTQSATTKMSTIAATATGTAKTATINKTCNYQQNQPSSSEELPQRDPLDVGFNDPLAAFKSKTTWELIRAYLVYIMCSSGYLVENNLKV